MSVDIVDMTLAQEVGSRVKRVVLRIPVYSMTDFEIHVCTICTGTI